MRSVRILTLGIAVLLVCASSWAQPAIVTHHNGLLTIQCNDAPLSSVFESIEREAGVDLILEDEIKSKRLTAELTDVPVAMAVQRLLEGTGVNYIVMMDPRDWGRVGKIFVGAGGGGPARSAQLPRGPVAPEPVDEAYPDEPQDAPDMMDFDTPDPTLDNPDGGVPPEEPGAFGDPNDPNGFGNPPGSSPIPDFLPPAQSFPRSNFTPGPRQNRPQTGNQPQQQNPTTPPPATFPFTDPFGQPIPIPPGMNPQQQNPNQQQQPQQRQRQQ